MVGGFGALYVAFFSPVLLRGALLAPGDALLISLPSFLTRRVLWDPFQFSGFPALGDPQNLTWYPLTLLLPDHPGAWNIFVLSGYVLASAFAYGYAHAVTRSRPAATVAGLVFGMSGFFMSHLGHTNMVHTAAWLPLLVWALEELREGPTARWAAAGAVAVGCMALAGHPQILAYALLLAGAYAAVRGPGARGGTWRYWAVAGGTVGLGLGLAAVMLVPGWELTRHSLRTTWTFQEFVSYNLGLRQLPQLVFPWVFGGAGPVFGGPPYEGPWFLTEITAYVGILPAVLGVAALAGPRRLLAWFWAVVAGGSLLLALGGDTPLASAAFRIPLLNRFRVPGRHAFELSFAMAALAGLGTGALWQAEPGRRFRRLLAGAVAAAGLVAAALLALARFPPASGIPGPLAPWRNPAVGVPLVLLAAGLVALWALARRPGRARAAAVLAVLALEAGSYGWAAPWHWDVPARDALAVPPAVAEYGAQAAASHQRIGSLLGALQPPGAATPNLASVWEAPSVNGSSPLILRRYAELAGMRLDGVITHAELEPANRALDLLATRYLMAPRAVREGTPTSTRAGMRWGEDVGVLLGSACGGPHPEAAELAAPDAATTAIGLVTSLGCSAGVPHGTEVARVTLTTATGETIAFPLRAGVETAEQAWERPDVRASVAHRQPEVFVRLPVTDQSGQVSYDSVRYVARVPLPTRTAVRRIRIERVGPPASVVVHHVSLEDGASGRTHAVSRVGTALEASGRWRHLGDVGDNAVYANTRVLPRAWLAPEALRLSREAVLASVRTSVLPDGSPFDPSRTALVERDVAVPGPGPAAPGAPAVPPGDGARVVRLGRTALEVQARSEKPAVLVLSDVDYPGWKATVDGRPSDVVTVDHVLRGVVLPAGTHRVRLMFEPASFRVGALASLGSLAMLMLLMVLAALQARRSRADQDRGGAAAR